MFKTGRLHCPNQQLTKSLGELFSKQYQIVCTPLLLGLQGLWNGWRGVCFEAPHSKKFVQLSWTGSIAKAPKWYLQGWGGGGAWNLARRGCCDFGALRPRSALVFTCPNSRESVRSVWQTLHDASWDNARLSSQDVYLYNPPSARSPHF